MSERWPLAALAAIALILIAPLWCVATPAMPDYPGHLASFALIDGQPSAYYHIHWIMVPNLAGELIVPVLARLFGLSDSTKLFLSLAVAMWVLGPAFLHRALFGRLGPTPLIGALFAINANFAWGFFNYYFAAGLSLCLFAAWVGSAHRNGILRTSAFALAAVLVYFCHIFAVALLFLLIFCFELSRPGQAGFGNLARRVGWLVPIFLPCAFLFLFRPRGQAAAWQFDLTQTMKDRLDSLIVPSVDHPATGLALFLLALLAIAVIARKAKIHRQMWLPLLVLLAATLLAPEEALGGWAVHLRLPAIFASLLFAATDLRLPRGGAFALAAAAMALVLWNTVALLGYWRLHDRQIQEFRTALRDLPESVRILTVAPPDDVAPDDEEIYWHIADYAVLDRAAFTSLMFTTKGQHVIEANAPYDRYAAASADQGAPADLDALGDLAAGRVTTGEEDFSYLANFPCHYDVAVVIGHSSIPPTIGTLSHSGSFFSLYRLRRPSCR